jgi:hypothetical protein
MPTDQAAIQETWDFSDPFRNPSCIKSHNAVPTK